MNQKKRNKGKVHTISYKKQLIFILSIFILPIIACLIFYNYYTVKTLDSQVAQSGINTVALYQSQLEYDLNKISLTVSDYWANDYDHMNMLRKVDELTRYESSYEIGLRYRTLMGNNKAIGALYIISQKNDLDHSLYKEGAYTVSTEDGMQKIVDEMLKDPMKNREDGWQPYAIDNKPFLFRIIGYNGGYTVIVIDMEQTLEDQTGTYQIGDSIFSFAEQDGRRMTYDYRLPDSAFVAENMNHKYYISGLRSKYMVVNKSSDIYHARLLMFIPYKGYFYLMDKMQMLLFILSFLLVSLIPCGYALIYKYYFRPVENLMETMKIIRDGNLDEKVESNYRVTEFQEFNDTFNQMIDEIKNLKIESWERELQKNRAELQYLQLQIKPHFFLNCLKNLYGMAELKRYDKMQNMILQISDYLRYFFKDNMSMVTVQDELNYVDNYISLFKYSMEQDVKCDIQAEDSIKECIIPVLLIQPFVENSFKYGRIEGQTLNVKVKIISLESEKGGLVDISVSDNGNGFSSDILEQLNNQSPYQYTENNVGIANIRQRLFLIYGDDAILQCTNVDNGHGSLCEIILPKEYQARTGEETGK